MKLMLVDVHSNCANLSRAALSMGKSFHTSIDGLEYSVHVLEKNELDLRPNHDIFGGWYQKLCDGDDVQYIYTGWSRKWRGCLVCVRGDRNLIEDPEPLWEKRDDKDEYGWDSDIPF